MTEDERAALVEALQDKVADAIQEAAVESSGVEDVWQWPAGWHTPINLAAKEVIALVTAARDAEIRKALLSDGAVIEAVESIRTSPVLDRSSYHSLPPEGPGAGEPGKWLGYELRREWREYVGRPAIEAALDHIGLHGEGTG